MTERIQNRDAFLNKIASRLGRERITTPVEPPKWRFHPQDKVMQGTTPDELTELLKKQCEEIHTSFYQTDTAGLADLLNEVVTRNGGGPVIIGNDERYNKWGLSELINKKWPDQQTEVHKWDYSKGDENIDFAEKANVGIAISEMALAESGTVVVYNNELSGRTINFLPPAYIALVPKSAIVPRLTQAAKKMREIELDGGNVPSCINFISGPSNSADIEMNLIVGVHGPIKASYIVINDL